MDVLITLKINDINGELLFKTRVAASDDVGYTLDEFITHYGEHIEASLREQFEPDEDDCGEVILRYSYLELCDEFDDEDGDEQDETDDQNDDEDGRIIEYADGVTMYDLSLTNERIFLRFGSIRMLDDEDGGKPAEE